KYTNKDIRNEEMNGIRLPFKNKREGNLFRKWVNTNYPSYAKEIDLEEDGSCSNCFIQLAWEKYYSEYIKTKEGKKLDFTPPETISMNEEEEEEEEIIGLIEEAIVTKHDEIDLTQFDIVEEYYIIIGCFDRIKNAKSYAEKIRKKGYTTYVFYEENAKCNFVSIGPYSDKQKSISDLPSIQKNIDKESWVYTKIVK
ncbi:MAG TPA: SPOR domain-containing protein, partial [Flavobacteriales bacterium]|nr:SPOR domain-containing protein [Flavobacteriales bacterium]